MDTQAELELLRQQVLNLGDKFDKMSQSINNIEKILAKQEGQSLALRLLNVEQKMQKLETDSASNSWLPETVTEQKDKVSELEKFQYKVLGIGITISAVISTLGVAFGHWIVGKLF